MLPTQNRYSFRTALQALILLVTLLFSEGVLAGEGDLAAKISPSLTLSYSVTNGVRSIKVQVKETQDHEVLPVSNLIVNLYLNEKKKYNASTGEGWMCNLLTNENGEGFFKLTDSFYKLMANTHEFRFIASIGSDPVFAETEQELVVKDLFIELKFVQENSQTSALATLYGFTDSARVVLAGRELNLYAKRNSSMVPLHKKPGITNEKGELKVVLPAILLNDEIRSFTLVARYADPQSKATTEVSLEFPLGISEQVKHSEPAFWAWGRNYWQRTVIVIISLFILFILLYKKNKRA